MEVSCQHYIPEDLHLPPEKELWEPKGKKRASPGPIAKRNTPTSTGNQTTLEYCEYNAVYYSFPICLW
jgi:hypothetical protein